MSNKFFDIEKNKNIKFNSFRRCCICNIPDFMALEMNEYEGKNYCELHIPIESTKEKLYQRYLDLMRGEIFII